MNRELEFWMPVRGYEGLYDASDWGRVRNARTGRVLKPWSNMYGYKIVSLKKQKLQVHRLVWEAFNGPIPEGMQIDHLNTVRYDNRLNNLRVCTPKENRNNPITKERHAKALNKLAQDQEWRRKNAESTRKACNKSVVQLDKTTGEVIKRWECAMDAHRELGVAFSNISSCCNGRLKTAGGYRWCYFMPPAVIYNRSTILLAYADQ